MDSITWCTNFQQSTFLLSLHPQVDIEINGEPVPLQMKLGEAGEAFFVEEVEGGSSQDLCMSPLSSSDNYDPNKKDIDTSQEVNVFSNRPQADVSKQVFNYNSSLAGMKLTFL